MADLIKIVLADDHAVVRKGLRLLLDGEEGLEVVAEAGTAEDAMRYVRAHRPTVLVLDLNMPGELTSLDAIPDVELAGEVVRVKAVGENKRGDITYTVLILPRGQDERLRWNMTTAVFIQPGEGESLAHSQ